MPPEPGAFWPNGSPITHQSIRLSGDAPFAFDHGTDWAGLAARVAMAVVALAPRLGLAAARRVWLALPLRRVHSDS